MNAYENVFLFKSHDLKCQKEKNSRRNQRGGLGGEISIQLVVYEKGKQKKRLARAHKKQTEK